MINIKEYVMNNAETDILHPEPYAFVGAIEVVEIDRSGKEHIIASGPASLTVEQTTKYTQQELLQGLVDCMFQHTYLNDPIPDNTRVYLHIDGKRYLINDVYRPELYY